MGLLNSNSLNEYVTKTIPRNARNLWGEIKRAPQDIKGLFAPGGYERLQKTMNNPAPLDKEKGMQMAMDYLQTTTPTGGLLGMFAGKGAKTADLVKQATAEKMLKEGADPAKVWKETGWGLEPGGSWVFEIPDDKFFYRGSEAAGSSYADDVMLHPELYDAYPSLKNIKVVETQNAGNGAYVPGIRESIEVGQGDGASSVALHELNHAVSAREGRAPGGGPDMFTRQKEAERARDILTTRNELLRIKEKYPKADSMNLLNKLVEDYQSVGAMDMLPSRIARDAAIQPNILNAHLYPDDTALTDLQDLVNLYGLNKYATPYSGDQVYKRLNDEALSRLVQKRMSMNAQQLAGQYPFDPVYFRQETGVPIDELLSIEYDGPVTGLLK